MDQKTMKNPKLLIGVTTIVFLLIVAVGLSQAQAPEGSSQPNRPAPDAVEAQPMGALAVTERVSSTFSYQGVLKESGQPVTGDRQMVFRLYADGTCTALVGSPVTYTVPVNNGLFHVNLLVDQADFDGQALWLETEVGGISVGCQAIQAVPYALSLRPGATISGSVAYDTVYGSAAVAILNDAGRGLYVERLGSGSGSAGYFVNNGSTAGVYAESDQGDGVFGQSDGTAFAAGVRGIASAIAGTTYGGYFWSNSDEGIGVYARGTDDGADLVLGGNANTGPGDDGKIYSDPAYPGSDIYLHSNDAVLIDLDEDDDEGGDLVVRNGADTNVFRVNESGDVSQLSTGDGLVKAAVYATCKDSGSIIQRSFNNAGGTITISDGGGPGQCGIDFGFDISNRFWIAESLELTHDVACSHISIGPNDVLNCNHWREDTGAGIDGLIMVLIY